MTATATELGLPAEREVDPEHKQKAVTVEERWDWSYAMLRAIWHVLRKGGVEGREIEEGVRDYMGALADSRLKTDD